MAALTPDLITIAVTVYHRRQYVEEAIASALRQSVAHAPNVIVVEDCGPDASLRDQIVRRFKNRITYFRNDQRRGLFDNWNACLEACRTPWLCILHDDDVLEPTFAASMLRTPFCRP